MTALRLARLGAGAPVVGATVFRRWVVVFLPGLGGNVRGDGDGLLAAAGGRGCGRGEDLGAPSVQGHGLRPERAADLAHGGGAHEAWGGVRVVGADPAELVPR